MSGQFLQIVEYTTSRYDEVAKLADEWRATRAADTENTVHPLRVTVAQSRDKPGAYVVMALFGSVADAQTNSEHPDTQAFAAQMATLCDGPPTFHNLTVIETHEPLS